MALLFLLWFFQDINILQIVKDLGFPISVAIGLLWFIYKVWVYVTKKVDEKDAQILDQTEKRNSLIEKITINQITTNEILKTHGDLLKETKDTNEALKDYLMRGQKI
jgi:hypothetical protein